MRTSSVVYAVGLLTIIAPCPLTTPCGLAPSLAPSLAPILAPSLAPILAPMGAAFAASPMKHAGNGQPAVEVRPEAATHNALESVLGREVRTSTDRDVGRIIDVLVDRNGRVEAVVIEFGGFLGIGTRKIAVDWSAVRFDAGGDRSVLPVDVTHDQLRLAPEYRPNEPAVVPRASN